MNTPAKAPLTRQQVIDRAAELGITADRLRFFDEETINGEGGGSAVDEVEFSVSATELYDYTQLTDVALRSVREPAEGLFIAESSKIIRRAHAAGMVPRSYLTSPKWLFDLADLIAAYDAPIFIGTDAAVEALTGFHLHRGALAAMHRPAMDDVSQLVAKARRIVVIEDVVDHTNVCGPKLPRPETTADLSRRSRVAVLEGLVDHTNVGSAFRNAAALGLDAVLVSPTCADPLYRRAVRVSMGTVFQVPWTRIPDWTKGIAELKAAGYIVAGMTLGEGAITLDELVAEDHEKLALVFGTEGHGITPETDALLDRRVTIPMMGGVDSLNVTAAAAVAFYATR
ncbi:TrmH family RNA methyltransferase [Brevibacterium aurantiacum]|uniref:Phosphatase n=1 Tax=Brevibacterium aurantiacum TaxID=273384 RepID=A0A2H1IVS7_BREAU|nr:RNA methyltransferase [Brevibacterium aurantiacum]PCC20079.1 phosphatase [Brevibacterium aurantiacum]GEB21293.1 rRNA methyltransferase [Brevibacterium aurantiacum]SMX62491.1 tRNA G18 (ribose-2'-O)-methylase SpoU [Brevibacterium aurantiacum]SMX79264.1 tRNA G18 (ribose-2'-O)-methylase SpoU [Brevibacterium aurantiacum]